MIRFGRKSINVSPSSLPESSMSMPLIIEEPHTINQHMNVNKYNNLVFNSELP